jgi:hypothetical protein
MEFNMVLKIKEIRVSFIWTKSSDADTMLPYLSRQERYFEEFEKAKKATFGNTDTSEKSIERHKKYQWLLPWKRKESQRFWQKYLWVSNKIGDLEYITKERAWERLMPLRIPRIVDIESEEGVRVNMEGFCFPFSVGVVATLVIKPKKPKPIKDMIDHVHKLIKAQYVAHWYDEKDIPIQPHSLEGLARHLFEKLNKEVIGHKLDNVGIDDPITIVNVIDVEDFLDVTGQVEVTPERMMYGLCSFVQDWAVCPVKDLVGIDGDSEVITKPIVVANGPVDVSSYHLSRRYATKRGRAIWEPEYFSDIKNRKSSETTHLRYLAHGCYLRNLTMTTLQINSLKQVIFRANDCLEEGGMSIFLSDPLQRAIPILHALWRGDKTAYETWLSKYAIENDKNFFTKLKNLSKQTGLSWD